MTPYAWYGNRLLCEGEDGRSYARRHTTLITRAIYMHLPRVNDAHAIEGHGCEAWADADAKRLDMLRILTCAACIGVVIGIGAGVLVEWSAAR